MAPFNAQRHQRQRFQQQEYKKHQAALNFEVLAEDDDNLDVTDDDQLEALIQAEQREEQDSISSELFKYLLLKRPKKVRVLELVRHKLALNEKLLEKYMLRFPQLSTSHEMERLKRHGVVLKRWLNKLLTSKHESSQQRYRIFAQRRMSRMQPNFRSQQGQKS